MSVDDKVGRDPRITWLAKELGWSKRELVGCFILELWPLCYDRLTPVLPARDIDVAVDRPGFAEALVAAGLGTVTRAGIRVAGASERIEYLIRAKEAGKRGGKASGKSRSSNGPSRGPRSNPPGGANLPDTVPDSVPDSVSAPDPDTPTSGSPPPAATRQVRPPKLKPVPPQEALDAAQRLMVRILQNQPGCSHARAGEKRQMETVTRWADAMRLLNERDHRSWEEISDMIDWCQQDNFWKSNILSADKLREKWDQLEAKRNRQGPWPNRDVRVGRVEPRGEGEYPDGDLTHLL